MVKKFKVNGIEKEWFYLTNNETIDLYKDKNTSNEDKEFLLERIIKINGIMDKKFLVNGREKEWFYLTNSEIIDLYEDKNTSNEDKEFLLERIIKKFKNELCPHSSNEDMNNVFVRQFSNFINSSNCDKVKTAKLLSKDHRYLVQEMFLLALEYIKVLAKDYEDGIYDGRNEYSCKKSSEIVDYLKLK